MSRMTTVGSPTTVPMTRLSPAGTAVAQWTADAVVEGAGAADGVPDVTGEVALEGVADELGVLLAVGAGPAHAASARSATRAAGVTRTA
jgi:hypothetical protein